MVPEHEIPLLWIYFCFAGLIKQVRCTVIIQKSCRLCVIVLVLFRPIGSH